EIQADATLRFAYDIWQSSEAQLEKRIDNHKSQVSNLTNEIYQLLGFVSAFQGLLLTAVAQASQLKCHNVGIPLALSLFATVVTLAGVCQKKGIITELKTTLSTEDLVRQAYKIRVQNLEQQGNKFMFNDLPQVTNRGTEGPAGTCSSKWITYNNGVVVCVLLLGGICSLFIYRVLCDASFKGFK
ncbi:hypothetical protein BDL97_13G024700, partial [Sphagnum fallax]